MLSSAQGEIHGEAHGEAREETHRLAHEKRTHREKFSGHVLNELVNPNVHWGHKKERWVPKGNNIKHIVSETSNAYNWITRLIFLSLMCSSRANCSSNSAHPLGILSVSSWITNGDSPFSQNPFRVDSVSESLSESRPQFVKAVWRPFNNSDALKNVSEHSQIRHCSWKIASKLFSTSLRTKVFNCLDCRRAWSAG